MSVTERGDGIISHTKGRWGVRHKTKSEVRVGNT